MVVKWSSLRSSEVKMAWIYIIVVLYRAVDVTKIAARLIDYGGSMSVNPYLEQSPNTTDINRHLE